MRALSVLLVAALAAMLPPPAVAAVAAAAAGPHAAGSPREPRGAWQQALATTLSWGPVGPPEPRGAWQQTLALLWNKSEGAAGFCIGGSRWRAEQLARESFPWPLPVAADGNDTVCSNRTRIEQHLCGPQEIEQYYKVGGRPRSGRTPVVSSALPLTAASHAPCPCHLTRVPSRPALATAVHAAHREPRKGPGQQVREVAALAPGHGGTSGGLIQTGRVEKLTLRP